MLPGSTVCNWQVPAEQAPSPVPGAWSDQQHQQLAASPGTTHLGQSCKQSASTSCSVCSFSRTPHLCILGFSGMRLLQHSQGLEHQASAAHRGQQRPMGSSFHSPVGKREGHCSQGEHCIKSLEARPHMVGLGQQGLLVHSSLAGEGILYGRLVASNTTRS